MNVVIRSVALSDAAAVAAIYNRYIRETVVTFEDVEVDGAEVARRIESVFAASFPWLVAEADGQLAGYAYATQWKARSGYRFSAEVTIYLAPDRAGKGIGSALYTRLFEMLRAKGIHAVIGGIALTNEASIALHEKFGMKKVAHFQETGFKFGRWIDVGYWEVILTEG